MKDKDMARSVSPNVRLFVIILMAAIGAGLNFFFGESVGVTPVERALWGGFIGGIIGQVFASYADS